VILFTDQFTRDLQKLPEADRRRVMDTAMKIQLDPDSNGLNPEKLKKNKDYWSYRATQDIRIIARREARVCSLVAVDRHDRAYARAEAGHLGGALDADILDFVKNASASPLVVDEKRPLPAGPLADLSDDRLSSDFGVPTDWIPALRSVRDRDALWSIGIEDAVTEKQFYRLEELFPLPSVVSTGARPVYRLADAALARAFAEGSVLDLQFNLPASSWSIIESTKRSPAFVKGGPGSGKTLVALYRALHVLEADLGLGLLAKPRVLYVTYTKQLCDDARNKIERLRGRLPHGLTISTYDSIAERLAGSTQRTVYPNDARAFLESVLQGRNIDLAFFESEVTECIQRRNLRAFDEYEQIERRGRGARLGSVGRRAVWECYGAYRSALTQKKCRDLGEMRMLAADASITIADTEKYDFVIVDEVQDLPLPTLLMVANLAKGEGRAKHLMLVGDAGQAIYNRGFRWSDVGLRIGGGNVHTLAQSERSTQEILDFAKALFGTAASGMGADIEIAASSKHGERPRIIDDLGNDEHAYEWLVEDVRRRAAAGVPLEWIAVIAHSHNKLASVGAALNEAEFKTVEQGNKGFYAKGAIKLITAHAAKGLEFREVYLPDINDGVYPFFKNRSLPDDERADHDVQDCQLLYVAATRAAEQLTVMYDRDPSPFLESARSLAVSMQAEALMGDSV
jgi:superfamily I DNA/RNA helicase/mRNA-degrading endonuclease RelE of RelBE toxin-antitoxin system